MSRAGTGEQPIPHDSPEVLGLVHGDRVRWMHGTRRRWRHGTVRYVEADGSVAIYDGQGLRSIPASHLAVERPGPRGGKQWLAVERLHVGQVAS